MRNAPAGALSVGAGFDVLTDRQTESWNMRVLSALQIIQLARLMESKH